MGLEINKLSDSTYIAKELSEINRLNSETVDETSNEEKAQNTSIQNTK